MDWSSSKIADFCRIEGCRTKEWARISPEAHYGAIRCCVATSYDDVRNRVTLVPLLTNQKFVMVGIKLILVIGFSQAKHQVDQNLDFD